MSAAKPIILYKNILRDGTVTITSEAGGFPKENLFDYRTNTFWKPTSNAQQNINIDMGAAGTSVDAIAILIHDLATQTARVRVLNDSTSAFSGSEDELLDENTVASDAPLYFDLSAAGTKRYWRIEITSLDAVCYIGQIFLGAKLTMEHYAKTGYDPDLQRTMGRAHFSVGGHYIGRQVKYTKRIVQAEFRHLTKTWFNANLLPFLVNHYQLGLPFFYVPDLTNLPSRVYYVAAPDDPELSAPSEVDYRHYTLVAEGIKQAEFLS